MYTLKEIHGGCGEIRNARYSEVYRFDDESSPAKYDTYEPGSRPIANVTLIGCIRDGRFRPY